MKGNKKYIRESFRLYLPPAVGYNFPLLMGLLFKYGVDAAFLGRAVVISLISLIGVPFRIYEKIFYDRRASKVSFEEPPVFILGHWRSGTTYLHNLLCQDTDSAYVTTYQSVFPDQTLTPFARFIFKNIMKMLIPINRKGDNVKLGTDYPQEEEFALAARTAACYYFFWYFPDKMLDYFDEFLTFEKGSSKKRKSFIKDYRRVIQKALINTGNKRFLSKNPVHTGRIPLLLEMFPDARFIYIHRNPVDVILSTRHFFSKMMPGLTLKNIDIDQINRDIYAVYNKLIREYLETKAMIPEGKLVEVSYDDLTASTMKEIRKIYDTLGFDGFEKAGPLIEDYANLKKNYVRNKYSIRQEQLDEILSETSFAMKHYNYKVPENIEIKQ